MPIGAHSIGTANHHKSHCAPLSVPGSGAAQSVEKVQLMLGFFYRAGAICSDTTQFFVFCLYPNY